jgi:hypothetical protein
MGDQRTFKDEVKEVIAMLGPYSIGCVVVAFGSWLAEVFGVHPKYLVSLPVAAVALIPFFRVYRSKSPTQSLMTLRYVVSSIAIVASLILIGFGKV